MNAVAPGADSVEFDPFSQEFFDGAYATYRRLRDEAPVYYSAQWDFWALTRYDDVAPATKDHETYSSAKGATLDMVKAHDDAIPVPKVIISMDPPEHQKMRKLVSNVFTPRAIASLEDMVREKVYERIEALDPSSFDVVADFSAVFPNDVITTMLGVPKEDRHQIRLWVDLLLERHPGEIAVPATGFEASMNTGIYYYNLIQKRRAEPQDDMISRLIETEIERDGQVEKLTDVDIAGFATLLGGAGAETVTKLVGNAMVAFADFPDQWQKLRDDRSKIPAAVEELLRYRGTVAVSGAYGHARCDVARHHDSRGQRGAAGDGLGDARRADVSRPRPPGHRPRTQDGLQSRTGLRHSQLFGCRPRANGGPHRTRGLARPDPRVRGRSRRTTAGSDGERLRVVECPRPQAELTAPRLRHPRP